MKILITGSNGFLGKYLIATLKFNNQLFTLSRSHSDFNFDLSKQIPVFTESFDCIIHSAGKAHYQPRNIQEYKLFFDTNVTGTYNLLSSLEKNHIPKYFVFISSVSVYGLNSGDMISETQPTIATDPYGLSKIKAENIINDWCIKNNIICTILRLPLVIGSNSKGNLSKMINGIHYGYYFNVGGGKAQKSMVLAKDVASIIATAAKVGGVFNLTDGYHPTFFELSYSISQQLNKRRVLNLPIIIAKIFAFIGDIIGNDFYINSSKLRKLTSNLTFDDSKARTIIGWKPHNVLEEFKVNK
jgi:nucleoside-diphosphate-sugar epimerase